jgi:hypothetical protein
MGLQQPWAHNGENMHSMVLLYIVGVCLLFDLHGRLSEVPVAGAVARATTPRSNIQFNIFKYTSI